MNSLIACAPCCWGVESATNVHNPSWNTVILESKVAGYQGIELGPFGYMPLEGEFVNTVTKESGLVICAGTLFEPLSSLEHKEDILSRTHDLCSMLKRIGSNKLVVIDCVNDVRSACAGLSDEAPRLDSQLWDTMMQTIRDIAVIAKHYGIRPVVHPHAGGYIEYRDEIDRMLADLTSEEVGLCLDTGHLYYAGMDPAGSLIAYASRLEYVHFKDINHAVFSGVIKAKVGFWEACAQGVMCPIGEGVINYAEVQLALNQIGYSDWITIEQERDPRNSDGTLADIKRSRLFLNQKGFG
ncbi:TIM barrel protein [Vibrio splendidus]|uniref:TIM barrel protein n=1 Tax=Vibrio splendidus TaxID=29497 RepID=UPI000D3D20DC|nr:TIM barrel protein [Vibrio splendidus]MDH6019278.1 sugar phosphate isomerase/epimerase [Vibrio splendidus]PTO61661.1 AP endonuclease [Vibrio splendidus]PTP26639.1 AP endonuclease [Vibrio splendidus]RIH73304.1 AP endonuclease [Vibrio splendidus]